MYIYIYIGPPKTPTNPRLSARSVEIKAMSASGAKRSISWERWVLWVQRKSSDKTRLERLQFVVKYPLNKSSFFGDENFPLRWAVFF